MADCGLRNENPKSYIVNPKSYITIPSWEGRRGGFFTYVINVTCHSSHVIRHLKNIMNENTEMDQVSHRIPDVSHGIYTYCLTRTPVSFSHTIIGIDGIHGVYLAEQDGIFAILSDVSLKEYSEAALDKNMTDMAWLVPRAKRHEEVIEFVMTHATLNQNVISNSPLSPPEGDRGRTFSPSMRGTGGGIQEVGWVKRSAPNKNIDGFASLNPSYMASAGQYTPVVPLRFCTIYKNREGLFKTIMPHKEQIINFLDYTADKTEWSVKVFCDKTIFVKYSDKNKEHSAATAQTPLLPGEAYLLAKKMHKIKEENFRQDLQMYLKDIDFTLSQFADSYRFLQCTDKSIHGRPLDMVMNTAFLVEQQTFNMFKNTLDMLAEKYRNEGLAFEFSGPWPPYNFCPAL